MVYYFTYSFSLKCCRIFKNKEWILGMEHNQLSLEYDRNLINSLLNDINCKYLILFLYIIRKDLFKNSDPELVSKYERVIILDEIFKNNVETFWDQDFIDIIIDVGLFKNIRNRSDYDRKEGDFILRMGDRTITVEKDTILTPIDTLSSMINRRFKSSKLNDFSSCITKLKEIRCESTSTTHRLIYEIGEEDLVLSDDLYELLDEIGNIYQAIKIEFTIEEFYRKFKENQEKLMSYTAIFDPLLDKMVNIKETIKKDGSKEEIIEFKLGGLKKIERALEDTVEIEKDQKLEFIGVNFYFKLSEEIVNINLSASNYQTLKKLQINMENLNKELKEIKSYYSGKNRKYSYLEFLEKIPELKEEIQKLLITTKNDIEYLIKMMSSIENQLIKID